MPPILSTPNYNHPLLTRHEKYHHADIKNDSYILSCKLCDKIFYDVSYRVKHEQKNHPYKCTHCNKQFSLKPHLESHQKTHQDTEHSNSKVINSGKKYLKNVDGYSSYNECSVPEIVPENVARNDESCNTKLIYRVKLEEDIGDVSASSREKPSSIEDDGSGADNRTSMWSSLQCPCHFLPPGTRGTK